MLIEGANHVISPLKIDVHTHILPETWPNLRDRYGYGGFVRLDHHKPCCARMMIDDKFFREVDHNCWDPKVRIGENDKTEVSVQVLSTVPAMFNYWAKGEDISDLSQILNDHIASVCENYPTRFLGLGTLPMQAPELAVKELERIKKIGLKGIQIGSHVNDWNLEEPALNAIWEAAQSLGLAIFIHPWDMMGQDNMKKYWLPWLVGMPAETTRAICSMIFGGVFARYPSLRVCFAHGGGSFPATVGRITHGFDVRPDLCAIDNQVSPRDYVGKFYIDSLVHDKKMLEYVVDLFGAEKVVLGSDYPFPLGEDHPGKLIEETFGHDVHKKDALLYKSALTWLGITDNEANAIWQLGLKDNLISSNPIKS